MSERRLVCPCGVLATVVQRGVCSNQPELWRCPSCLSRINRFGEVFELVDGKRAYTRTIQMRFEELCDGPARSRGQGTKSRGRF